MDPRPHSGPAAPRQIRVVVGDDDAQLRAALTDTVQAASDLTVVGEAGDATAIVKAACELKPDVVLLDVRMPGGGGSNAARAIKKCHPAAGIVALCAYEDQSAVLEMIQAGALGYLVKGSPEDEIIEAIRRAARGQFSLAAEVGRSLIIDLAQEIAERRRTEAELRRSDERFQALLRAAPDALIMINGRGTIELVNAQVEQLFGYSTEQLLGQPVETVLPDRFREVHVTHRAEYMADPRTRPMGAGLALFGRRSDGSEFPVDISLSPLETEEGRLVVAAVRDVSDRKHAEREIAHSLEVAERQRLFAHLVRVQEEERLKIASDIHDDTIQAMTSASLRLQQLRRHIANERDLELLGKLEAAVHESIVRLRRLMFDLRPPALDRSGLAAALRDLLDRLHDEAAIDATLTGDLAAELPAEVRTALYRIAQEAITNVRKHSNATSVTVELATVEAGCRVTIVDNGIGFQPEDIDRPGHLGTVAMRERARMAGGWWRAERVPAGGTKVEFWVPLENRGDPLLPPLTPG